MRTFIDSSYKYEAYYIARGTSPAAKNILLIFQIVSFIRTNLMMNENNIYMQKSRVTFIEIYYFHWFTLIDRKRMHNVYMIDYRLTFYFWYNFLILHKYFKTMCDLIFYHFFFNFDCIYIIFILDFSYIILTRLSLKINCMKLEHWSISQST